MSIEIAYLVLGIGIGAIVGMISDMILKKQPFIVIYETKTETKAEPTETEKVDE